MNAIRTLLFMVLSTVYTICYAILCVLIAFLPLPIRYKFTMGWTYSMNRIIKYMLGIKWEIEGLEHLPDHPVIIMSKHQSAWETFFLASELNRDVCYVYKRELNYIPFFGWSLALLNMIPINRSKGSQALEQLVTKGKEQLARGRSIIIFPEGTRIPVGQQGRYKTGGARLAIQTQTPILPIALNPGELWSKTHWIKKPGTVRVVIGPMISSSDQTPEQLTKEVETWIETEMRQMNPERYVS